MGKKNDVPLKEKYRLWREFLKRSKQFHKVCNWDKETLDKYTYGLCIENNEIHRIIKSNDPLFYVIDGYRYWGNIYEIPFEKWWATFSLKPKPNRSVKSLGERIENIISEIIEFLKSKKRGKTLSIEEFTAKLIDDIKSNYPYLFISINLYQNETTEDIVSQCRKIVRKAKREINIGRSFGRRWVDFTDPFFYEQVEKYLKIYEMRFPISGKKGKTVKEIAKYYYSQEEGKKEVDNPERIINEVIAKAKKIIINAENGIFPGKY